MFLFKKLKYALVLFLSSIAVSHAQEPDAVTNSPYVYFYQGDLNGDGIEDTIGSGPPGMFGRAGGPFVISLSVDGGGFAKNLLGLRPDFVVVERDFTFPPGDFSNKPPYAIKVWTYWRMSSNGGNVIMYRLKGQQMEKVTFPLDFTPLGEELFQTIFTNERTLKFKRVENYVIPDHPYGHEWGKP